MRAQLVEQEAIDRRFQKERKEKIMKAYEEKELLRRIAALKKKNEITTSAWQLEIVGQVEQLKLQEKKLIKNQDTNQEGPVIQQIKTYKTLEAKRDVEHVVDVQDKGKQKEVGNRINEPVKTIQIYDSMSPSNIELEKRRKERDDSDKKLEITESEATIAEMNNKIKFLEITKKKFVAMPKGNIDTRFNNVDQNTTQVLVSFLSSFSQRWI